MIKRTIVACFFLLACLAAPLAADIVVEDVAFDIKGATKQFVVAPYLDIEGRVVANEKELNAICKRAKQNLINLQIFSKVSCTWEYVDKKSGTSSATRKHARVKLSLVDHPTIWPIPVIRYDSNTGGKVGLKLKYPNAFGLLSMLQADLVYKNFRSNSMGAGTFETKLGLTRVPLFDRTSSFNTSLRYDLKNKQAVGTAEINIGFWGPWHTAMYGLGNVYVKKGYQSYQYGVGFSKSLSPLGLSGWYVSPRIKMQHEKRKSGLSHTLRLGSSFGRSTIDWHGYLREGWSVGAYYELKIPLKKEPKLSHYFSLQAQQHFLFKTVGLRYRVIAQVRSQGYGSIGSNMRGVLNSTSEGRRMQQGITANIDVDIPLFSWNASPVLAFMKSGEMHMFPFLDLGFSCNEKHSFNPVAFSTGVEFAVFFDRARSIKLSAIAGLNLSTITGLMPAKKMEKEFIISLSTFY